VTILVTKDFYALVNLLAYSKQKVLGYILGYTFYLFLLKKMYPMKILNRTTFYNIDNMKCFLGSKSAY